MPKEINLPPEWERVAIVCPNCKAPLLAKHNPNNKALEALRCSRCTWRQDYVLIARQRAARLAAARRKHSSTKDRQARFN